MTKDLTGRGNTRLVPPLLRREPGDFIPHTFTIGDSYQTNFSTSIGQYTLLSAYNRTDTPGSSVPHVGRPIFNFAYTNINLRPCDVLQITLTMTFSRNGQGGISKAMVRQILIGTMDTLLHDHPSCDDEEVKFK